MTSIKIKFRASTVAGKPGSLYFQIIHRRKTRQVTVPGELFLSEWDSRSERVILYGRGPGKERTKELHSLWEQLQRDKARFYRIVHELEGTGEEYDVEDIVGKFHARISELSFFRFLESTIYELEELGKMRTSETYASALRSFRLFRNGNDAMLDEITSELMLRYDTWLRNKGNTRNTSSFYMRILRAAYNRAVERGLTVQANPFRHVYTGVEKTVKRAVPFRFIKKIKEMQLPKSSTLEWARDLFMFSFYTRGMSFVDMAYLRKRDLRGCILSYRRRKTGQLLNIRWEACMQQIVDKYADAKSAYLLPIIRHPEDERRQYENALHLINAKLKEISRMGNLPTSLSMHVARHSWATAARSNHIPVSVISEGMGHGSESTTLIYLASLDSSAIDKANRTILKSVGIQ